MPTERASADGLRAGLISSLLLAIPIWVAIGLGLIAFVGERQPDAAENVVLAFAGMAELVLFYYAWHMLGWRFGLRAAIDGPASEATPALGALLRRSSLLVGLVGAYLHYYFWDVYLQIESLNSVTVFVPLARLG